MDVGVKIQFSRTFFNLQCGTEVKIGNDFCVVQFVFSNSDNVYGIGKYWNKI